MNRKKSERNKTITLSEEQKNELEKKIEKEPEKNISEKEMKNKIYCGDMKKIIEKMPDESVDLLFLDPPYNLEKDFGKIKFKSMNDEQYEEYLESWFPDMMRILKKNATVYLCGDWKCSSAEYRVMNRHLKIRNRIIWEREKGRGAKMNWKNCCEDIWFGTVSDEYVFNIEDVKTRRKVIATYRDESGKAKDWQNDENGKWRMTFPSNFWNDITVPYWSMPENTEHPTQKPEKLLAKLILASSNPGDMIFDPFVGSGTSAVTAKKLGRSYCGIEFNPEYCLLAAERLKRADDNTRIQGYENGIFNDRNYYSK